MSLIKSILSALVICFIAIACSTKPATSYTITGTIDGLEDGTVLQLIPGATHKSFEPIAESVTSSGRFNFTGSVDQPRLFYLKVKDGYGVLKIMIENGSIKIAAKTQKRESDGSIFYNFENLKISGSHSHDLYLKKMAPHRMLDSIYLVNNLKHKDIYDKISTARNNKDNALLDSLSNTAEGRMMAADEIKFFQAADSIVSKIITDNSESWWGPLLMLDMLSYLTPKEESWYKAFSQEAKESYYGKIVARELYPEGLVGKKVSALTLTDRNKSETTLSAVTQGKKFYLVDFWASWCAPCRKEIPNLKKLYKQYSSRGLEIVSISIDKKEADWIKALDEEKLQWPNFLDNKSASSLFEVKTIPAIFIVDDEGLVIAEKIRGEELEAKLAELFK